MKLEQMLRALPEPTLSTERRRRLAAEVLAGAEIAFDRQRTRRARRRVAVAIALPIAAAVALVAWPRATTVGDAPALDHAAHRDEPSTATRGLPPRSIEAPRAPAIADEPVVVEASHPPARIDGTRSQFAGSGDRHRVTIEQELLLESSVAHFRAGWEALRAQRYDDAIAAFDRATDPAVAEDAAFWAAVAAQRARRDDARQRFETFLERFPGSPRAEAARRALLH